jgi:hypothetical protein
MPICDGCGRYYDAQEAGSSEDTRTQSVMEGMQVRHWGEQVKFCPQCARSRGGVVWAAAVAVALLVAGILALALLGRG